MQVVGINWGRLGHKEKTISLEMNDNLDFEYAGSLKTKVVNALGMHARPAAQIAKMAQTASGEIWLSDGSSTVDASSIIDILSLCAVAGTKVLILTEKEEDLALADQVKNYFDIGFGEDENE